MAETVDMRSATNRLRRSSLSRRAGFAALVSMIVGCGGSAHQAQLLQLRKAVDDLRTQLARYDSKVESLSDEVVVLNERVTAVRVEVAVPEIPAGLDVVRLTPAGAAQAPQSPSAPQAGHTDSRIGSDPDDGGSTVEIVMGNDGELRLRDEVPSERGVALPQTRSGHAAGRELFSRALRDFRRGQPDVALAGFEMFLHRYPDHVYVPNALYWVGECRFEQGLFDSAAEAFERLVSAHPSCSKVPDALLKLGLSHERSARQSDARRAFADLIAAYPRTALADLARNHLARSEQTGAGR